MLKFTSAKIVFAGMMIVSSTAMAGSLLVEPIYIGDRSVNPEQETYGYPVKTEDAHPLAFMGPARNIGPLTGNAERDTIAYHPMLGVQKSGLWSFWLARQ